MTERYSLDLYSTVYSRNARTSPLAACWLPTTPGPTVSCTPLPSSPLLGITLPPFGQCLGTSGTSDGASARRARTDTLGVEPTPASKNSPGVFLGGYRACILTTQLALGALVSTTIASSLATSMRLQPSSSMEHMTHFSIFTSCGMERPEPKVPVAIGDFKFQMQYLVVLAHREP